MVEALTDLELRTLAMQFRAHLEQRAMVALGQAVPPTSFPDLATPEQVAAQQSAVPQPVVPISIFDDDDVELRDVSASASGAGPLPQGTSLSSD
eukprot:1482954-Alexandrium_andersonii.AAC.1